MKHSNKTKKANSKINNSNKKEGTTEMKDILTRKFDTITMEEFMELKMITEHDTDSEIQKVNRKDKEKMTTKLFYDAEDIMEIMRIKKSSAYRLIKELNEELNDMGILTQGGVVRADYFRERVYM